MKRIFSILFLAMFACAFTAKAQFIIGIPDTDGTLSHNYDTYFPTEKAVLTYLSTHSVGVSVGSSGQVQYSTGSGNWGSNSAFTSDGSGNVSVLTLNGLTVTSSTGTFTLTNGKTFSVAKTLTFTGTDGTTITYPSTSCSVARTDAAQSFIGAQTIPSGVILNAPNVQTGSTYTVGATDNFITANASGTLTLTLPTATAGRVLWVRTIAAFTVVSASSNVLSLASNSAGTGILAGTAGKWAQLVGDGTNWEIVASN